MVYTFRCLEAGHTFELRLPDHVALVLTQTATCAEHASAAVRVDERELRLAQR